MPTLDQQLALNAYWEKVGGSVMLPGTNRAADRFVRASYYITAAQIDTLAQSLSDTPIEPATSAKKAGDNLARLLAARIGAERAALAFSSIMTADTKPFTQGASQAEETRRQIPSSA